MPKDLIVSTGDIVPEFVELFGDVDATASFPNVLAALNQVAALYRQAWIGFASGMPIPGTPQLIRSRGTYKNSIKMDLSGDEKTVYSDSKINEYIEDGHEAIDLKPGLLAGPKARQGEKGPYNIVRFRHGTPGTLESNNPMPINIYSLVQKNVRQANQQRQAMTQKLANQKRAQGVQKVVSSGMQQGKRSKLVSGMVKGLKNYTWAASPYASMQRVTGEARSSQYMTFRVVSYRSDPASWIVPPKKGIPIRQIVVDEVKTEAEEMLREALEMDLS